MCGSFGGTCQNVALLNNGHMFYAADKHFKAYEDTLITATDAAGQTLQGVCSHTHHCN
jgi:hypothetical protein